MDDSSLKLDKIPIKDIIENHNNLKFLNRIVDAIAKLYSYSKFHTEYEPNPQLIRIFNTCQTLRLCINFMHREKEYMDEEENEDTRSKYMSEIEKIEENINFVNKKLLDEFENMKPIHFSVPAKSINIDTVKSIVDENSDNKTIDVMTLTNLLKSKNYTTTFVFDTTTTIEDIEMETSRLFEHHPHNLEEHRTIECSSSMHIQIGYVNYNTLNDNFPLYNYEIGYWFDNV